MTMPTYVIALDSIAGGTTEEAVQLLSEELDKAENAEDSWFGWDARKGVGTLVAEFTGASYQEALEKATAIIATLARALDAPFVVDPMSMEFKVD